MYRLIVLALALAACAAPAPRPAYRDARVPIRSAAALDPARLEGRWTQVAALAAPGAPPCRGASLAFGPQGARVDGTLCVDGTARRVAGAVRVIGPGRLAVAGEAAPWWVLWLDEGARTLVIGTPDGSFGAVFDRGAIPPDRMQAAREILAWNGYDLTRLQP
jgi:apolipoprotein D and lipocalin family protein